MLFSVFLYFSYKELMLLRIVSKRFTKIVNRCLESYYIKPVFEINKSFVLRQEDGYFERRNRGVDGRFDNFWKMLKSQTVLVCGKISIFETHVKIAKPIIKDNKNNNINTINVCIGIISNKKSNADNRNLRCFAQRRGYGVSISINNINEIIGNEYADTCEIVICPNTNAKMQHNVRIVVDLIDNRCFYYIDGKFRRSRKIRRYNNRSETWLPVVSSYSAGNMFKVIYNWNWN